MKTGIIIRIGESPFSKSITYGGETWKDVYAELDMILYSFFWSGQIEIIVRSDFISGVYKNN